MIDVQQTLAAWETCDKTDTLFVLTCSVFCWAIVPAVGLAYGGYSTRHNGLASFYSALVAVAVCSVQWWLIGYSLTYGGTGPIIGGFAAAFHRGVLAEPVGTIPAVLFSFFQLVFQATVCAITVGGFCERGRILPIVAFVFLWSTFIYNPLAHMVWGGGFLGDLGVYDFAGGTPVHICSGASATAISIYLSYPLFRSRRTPKRNPSHLSLHRPHNILCQLLSMLTIWGSWLAFDAGTTLAFNFKSVMALCVTNLCASSGALTYASWTYLETGKWSLDATFLGAISGLIMITPAAGFVDLSTSFFLGVAGAAVSKQALRIKVTGAAQRWRWVDNGDSFATHCVCGVFATVCTGLFARRDIAALDGETDIPGGVFFDGHIVQLGLQLLEACVGLLWAFIGSYVIMAIIDCVPGLEVLAEDADVVSGMDASQMAESLWADQWKGEEDYYPFSSSSHDLVRL